MCYGLICREHFVKDEVWRIVKTIDNHCTSQCRLRVSAVVSVHGLL